MYIDIISFLLVRIYADSDCKVLDLCFITYMYLFTFVSAAYTSVLPQRNHTVLPQQYVQHINTHHGNCTATHRHYGSSYPIRDQQTMTGDLNHTTLAVTKFTMNSDHAITCTVNYVFCQIQIAWTIILINNGAFIIQNKNKQTNKQKEKRVRKERLKEKRRKGNLSKNTRKNNLPFYITYILFQHLFMISNS